MSKSPAFGVTIKEADIDAAFLTGPAEFLVAKTLLQLSQVKGFVALFGPYKADASGNKLTDQQRWADYQRMDWSIRQLPAINIFESGTENKQSDNAYMTGTVQIQVYWPPNFRRSDLSRVPAAFRGALVNFFSSQYVADMLDELYYIQRPAKVYGLNEYGKQLAWSPNVEGVVDGELVPVTILDVSYRMDLRAWYRALEYMDRTKADPFDITLTDLVRIYGDFAGVDGSFDGTESTAQVVIQDGINVSNP